MTRRLGNRRRWGAALVLLGCGWSALSLWTGDRAAVSSDVPPPRLAVPGDGVQQDPRWIGVASCGATACHGGNGLPGSKGSEYTTWITRDPHAEAYNVLFNKRSERIAKNLRTLLSNKPAHESQVCLNCHSSQPKASSNPKEPARVGPDFDLTFGVGCESCHGPAEKWLGPHTTLVWQSKGWHGADAAEKMALGMVNTKSLTGRAQACVKCHIGDADRDVNHDLIAAGHPRLNFEFGAYHALLPKHWRERRSASDPRDKDKDVMPDFEARAWAVGQIVSAQAALELLAHRAESKQAPWPELAEFDCYACHHDLQKTSWRQQRGSAGRRPGSLASSDWHFALLSQALGERAQNDAPWQRSLAQLQKVRQAPSASRIEVAVAAKKAALALDRMRSDVEQAQHGPADLRQWMARISQNGATRASADWDDAAQTALALQALNHALGDIDLKQRDPRVTAAIKEMLRGLEFRARDNVSFDSPRDFSPQDYQATLKEIRDLLTKGQ